MSVAHMSVLLAAGMVAKAERVDCVRLLLGARKVFTSAHCRSSLSTASNFSTVSPAPLLVPFARQMYVSAHMAAAVQNSGLEARIPDDMRVQKVGFFLRGSPRHVLEVTATRTTHCHSPRSSADEPDKHSARPMAYSGSSARRHDIHVSVASQIGCKHNCSYCVSSSLGGLRRNLELEEMLSQALFFRDPNAFAALDDDPHRLLSSRDRSGPSADETFLADSNSPVSVSSDTMSQESRSHSAEQSAIGSISMHGHGEPLDNPHVFEFLDFLRAHYALAFGARGKKDNYNSRDCPRTSVSTVGILDPLERLLSDFPETAVTWTLNTPFTEQRGQLMGSVESSNPLDRVMDMVRTAVRTGRKNVGIGYLLLRDVNDSPSHLSALIDLLDQMPVPVSLVQFHPVLVHHKARDPRMPSHLEFVSRPSSGPCSAAALGHVSSQVSTCNSTPETPQNIWFEPSSMAIVDQWVKELRARGIPVAVQQYFEFPSLIPSS